MYARRQLQALVRRRSIRTRPPEPRGHGKSSGQACQGFQYGEALLPLRRSEDYTRGSGNGLHAWDSTHSAASVEEARCASLECDGFTLRISGKVPQSILTPIFENELNRLNETRTGFGLRATLPIRTGDFGAIGDIPVIALFENRREFVFHGPEYKRF